MGLFRKGKTCIIAKVHWTDLVICTCSHSREGKIPSYSQINTVSGFKLPWTKSRKRYCTNPSVGIGAGIRIYVKVFFFIAVLIFLKPFDGFGSYWVW